MSTSSDPSTTCILLRSPNDRQDDLTDSCDPSASYRALTTARRLLRDAHAAAALHSVGYDGWRKGTLEAIEEALRGIR